MSLFRADDGRMLELRDDGKIYNIYNGAVCGGVQRVDPRIAIANKQLRNFEVGDLVRFILIDGLPYSDDERALFIVTHARKEETGRVTIKIKNPPAGQYDGKWEVFEHQLKKTVDD